MASDLRALDEEDRISDLPKDITDEILGHLPIREAVKTSLLSSHWKCRWMYMPYLVFPSREADNAKLANLVNKIILLHQGAVYKFELKLLEFQSYSCFEPDTIDNWILVLSRKMVNHFSFMINSSRSPPYQVPECLFSCQALSYLTLGRCTMKLPSYYQGFNHLTELHLYYVTSLTEDTVEILVGKLPLLQTMMICHCTPLTKYSFAAPNLVLLCITSRSCDTIDLHNARNIKYVKIQVWRPDCPAGCSLDAIIGGLDRVEVLMFDHPFLEFAQTENIPERLGVTCHELWYAILHINFEDLKQTLALFCLCRSSPSLELLNITAVWDKEPTLLCGENFWEQRLDEEDDVLHCLHCVQLTNFKGLKCDLEFIRYVLFNAVALEDFFVIWEESIPLEETLNVQLEVMQFKRASSMAKVIFQGAGGCVLCAGDLSLSSS